MGNTITEIAQYEQKEEKKNWGKKIETQETEGLSQKLWQWWQSEPWKQQQAKRGQRNSGRTAAGNPADSAENHLQRLRQPSKPQGGQTQRSTRHSTAKLMKTEEREQNCKRCQRNERIWESNSNGSRLLNRNHRNWLKGIGTFCKRRKKRIVVPKSDIQWKYALEINDGEIRAF